VPLQASSSAGAAGVDADASAWASRARAGGVVADRGDQRHRRAHPRQVLGDVARHAAEGFDLAAGFEVPIERPERAQLAVQVGRADAQDRPVVGQHIGAPEQAPFAHQAGDVAGHRRTRQPQLGSEVLLRDEGIGADQLVQLFFFGEFGHGFHSFKQLFFMLDKCLMASNPPFSLYMAHVVNGTDTCSRDLFSHINEQEKWYLPYISTIMHSYNNFWLWLAHLSRAGPLPASPHDCLPPNSSRFNRRKPHVQQYPIRSRRDHSRPQSQASRRAWR
jgi:hypothetical protein